MKLIFDSATKLRLKALYVGVITPLAVLILALKSLRIIGPRELEHFSEAFPLYRSDILLLILFSVAGSMAISYLRSKQRDIAIGTLQVCGILWACIEVVAHQFYAVTGSTIDFGIFLFSVQRLSDTGQVILSEVPGSLVLLLILVILTILFLPWYIIFRSVVDQQSGPLGWKSLVAIISVGFTVSAWSVIPIDDNDDPGFTRSNLINFAFSLTRLNDEMIVGETPRESLRSLTLLPELSQSQKKNLVFVILESTRASATTMHNPDLPTTPFLDSLKSQSLFAERAYAVVPHTSKALVAILCGLEPHLTMPITEASAEGIPARCLPALLDDVGYQSVFFQSATQQFEEREGLVGNMGYHEFFPLESLDQEGWEQANYFALEDAVMLPKSREWLESNGNGGPFIATYLTGTPHHDYLAPRKRYGFEKFSEEDEFNRYLNSVRYVDQFSRELVDQYKSLNLLENTLFVFVGDHGEAFNEHGRSQHDNVMWEEGLHVPLMIYDPAAPVGKVVSSPVSQLDLLPTLMKLMDFDLQGAKPPGQAIWDASDERILFAHCWYELGCMASIKGKQKFIEHFGRRNNEYYDLLEDQGEFANLHSQLDPLESDRLKVELFTWRQSVNNLYISD